jgi:ankyrin repeat protein
MIAVRKGQLESLRLLLGRGAAVDTLEPTDGCTAFHYACLCNQAECAEALVRAGCDVGIKDTKGRTGREMAEAEGHAAVVARLRAVVAEQLRAAQAAVGSEALELAAGAGGKRILTIGAGGNGLAEKLIVSALEGDGAEMARLLAAGADPNASVTGRYPSGEVVETPALMAAAQNGRLEAARLLLDAGADPDRAASNGAIWGETDTGFRGLT